MIRNSVRELSEARRNRTAVQLTDGSEKRTFRNLNFRGHMLLKGAVIGIIIAITIFSNVIGA